MQTILSEISFLAYTLPAAFLLLYFHEIFRNFVLKNLHSSEPEGAIVYVDPVSMASLAFFGIAGSGLNQKGRQDSFISFLLSQLFFLIWIGVVILYTYLKQPALDSYLYNLINITLQHSFAIFLWNWLPLPPLSASFFYWQRFYNQSNSLLFTIIVRIVFLIVLSLLPVGEYWWRGSSISHLLNLTG